MQLKLKFKTKSFRKLLGWAIRKTCLRVYADREGPDQPAHTRSLIRAFIVRLQNHWRANARMRLRMRGTSLNLCILCMFEDTFSLGTAELHWNAAKATSWHVCSRLGSAYASPQSAQFLQFVIWIPHCLQHADANNGCKGLWGKSLFARGTLYVLLSQCPTQLLISESIN